MHKIIIFIFTSFTNQILKVKDVRNITKNVQHILEHLIGQRWDWMFSLVAEGLPAWTRTQVWSTVLGKEVGGKGRKEEEREGGRKREHWEHWEVHWNFLKTIHIRFAETFQEFQMQCTQKVVN